MKPYQDLGSSGVRCPECKCLLHFAIGGGAFAGYLREGERVYSKCCDIDVTDLMFPPKKKSD